MRFNPPPNWPAPPPGWVPDPNWTPDPSWPPPPPGWRFWVDDSESAAVPAGRAPRRALWITLTAVAAVVVTGAVFAALVLRSEHRTSAGGGKPSGKADITELTRDLLVGKSAFPDFAGALRSSGLDTGDTDGLGTSDVTVDPEECAVFYGYAKAARQTAYVAVSKPGRDGLRSMELRLAITPDQPDLKGTVEKCRTFTVALRLGAASVAVQTRLDPLEAPAVPRWAVATVMKNSSSPLPGIPITVSTTTATIAGYYRGVLVIARDNEFRRHASDGEAGLGAQTVDDLVRLFDAQVEQLEAAP